MPDPLVSFVVPVYNPPLDIFQELLDGFIRQTEPRWECVLVDDASPSDTVREVLAARAAADDRFTVVLRPTNGGIAAATNDGLDVASAPIVAFADHDDLVDDDAVAELAAHFDAHPEHGLVYTDERVVHADGDHKYAYRKPDYSPIRHLGQNYVNHITAFRRELVGDLRVRTSFEPAQDSDFVHRAIERVEAAGSTVGHIPKMLYSWRAIGASSALDAGVKSGMFDSSRAAVEATIERLDLDIKVSTIVYQDTPTPNQRLDPPAIGDDEIETFALTNDSTPADINAAIRACRRRFLALVPDGVIDEGTTPGWLNIVAADVTLPGVVAAGPFLRRANLNLLSIGRSVELNLEDPYWNHPMSGGPWGSWLVAREVTAVAPECAVIDVEVARELLPIPEPVRLDVGFAAWSQAARNQGRSTIITPRAEVVLDRGHLLDEAANEQRMADFASIARTTRQSPIEQFAISDPVDTCWYPTAWEVATHLVEFDGFELVSIALENGLVAHRSSADPAWVLDNDAADAIANIRAKGGRVCIVSHDLATPQAVIEVLVGVGFDSSTVDAVAIAAEPAERPSEALASAWLRQGVEPSRVIHAGTDPASDLTAAAEAGATALLLDVAPAYSVGPRPGPNLAAWLAAGGDDGGLLRVTRSTLVGAGDVARSPGYLFGATVLGPLMLGGYAGDIDHPVVSALLAMLATKPGVPGSNATAPFDPGDVRSGNQQAARRAVNELRERLTSATPSWGDPTFRDALIADAVHAVSHPNVVLGALLTLWSNGAWVAPDPQNGSAATNEAAPSPFNRLRSRLRRRQHTNP